MLALYRTVSLRYLWLRWPLNSLVVLSIALGVSIWVATSTLYQSLEQSILVSVNPLPGLACCWCPLVRHWPMSVAPRTPVRS